MAINRVHDPHITHKYRPLVFCDKSGPDPLQLRDHTGYSQCTLRAESIPPGQVFHHSLCRDIGILNISFILFADFSFHQSQLIIQAFLILFQSADPRNWDDSKFLSIPGSDR